MAASGTTEWKETCWKLLHGRQMRLLPQPQASASTHIASVMVNKGHHCPSVHRRVVSLSAAELPVVLTNALAKHWTTPGQVASLLLNKTEWKIQGLWNMGISHVKPAKLSTRTGWLLPVGTFTDLEMLPNTRKGATYTHAISFSEP